MKKTIVILLLIIGIVTFLTPSVSAQMMGVTGSPMMQGQANVTPSAQDLQDIQTGQDLYTKFQNKQVLCNNLQDDDFEKIGEYLMEQQFGNTNTHIQMNERMKSMTGDQGEEQMHIAIARSATGCNNGNLKGGVFPMMGWGYPGMMGWNGFGILPFIIQLFVLIDLILLGILLWKKIQK